jgi:hypothetical protein
MIEQCEAEWALMAESGLAAFETETAESCRRSAWMRRVYSARLVR